MIYLTARTCRPKEHEQQMSNFDSSNNTALAYLAHVLKIWYFPRLFLHLVWRCSGRRASRTFPPANFLLSYSRAKVSCHRETFYSKAKVYILISSTKFIDNRLFVKTALIKKQLSFTVCFSNTSCPNDCWSIFMVRDNGQKEMGTF